MYLLLRSIIKTFSITDFPQLIENGYHALDYFTPFGFRGKACSNEPSTLRFTCKSLFLRRIKDEVITKALSQDIDFETKLDLG